MPDPWRRACLLGVTAFGAAVVADPASARPAPVVVTSVTPISGVVAAPASCKLPQDENTAQLAVDPADSRHLVASYVVGAGVATVVATSHDGGTTWSRQRTDDLTNCGGSDLAQGLDPDLAIGPTGLTWLTEGFLDTAGDKVEHDAVREYAAAARAGQAYRDVDIGSSEPLQRGWLSADPLHPQTAYLLTERADFVGTYLPGLPIEDVTLRASTDAGRSWQLRGTVATPAVAHAVLAGGLERSHGALVAIVHDVFIPTAAPALLPTSGSSGPPGTAVAYRSSDGGRTWSRAGVVANEPGCCLLDTASAPDGTLYVTWPQAGTNGGSDVFLAVSRDGGFHWHSRTLEHSPGSIPLTTAVAVQPNGTVGVFWYAAGTLQSRPNDLLPCLAVSRNAGATWSAPVALSKPFDPGTIKTFNDTSTLGPYQDLVGVAHGFDVAFTAGGANVTAGGTSDVLLARVRVR